MGRDPAPRWLDGKAAFFFGIVAGVLALDFLTKQLAQRALPLGRPVPVIGDYVSLLFIENRGVAFGISLGPYGQWITIVLSIAALAALAAMCRATAAADRRRLAAMALIWGGAIGNLVDRMRSAHGVVDFLTFEFRSWQSPVFNVADVAVTTGAVLLALALWRDQLAAGSAPSRERRRDATPTRYS